MQIEHQCPQCGGQILLEETDRLLQCDYCKARLYIQPHGHFEYYFPPRQAGNIGETIFAPYWRFRGMHFQCRTAGIREYLIDKNLLAVNAESLPATLGTRPQSLKLKFLSFIENSRFIKPQISFSESLVRAQKKVSYELVTTNTTRLISIDGGRDVLEVPETTTELKEDRLYHEAFIGETVSIVYTPFFLRDSKVHDGITGNSVASSDVVNRFDSIREVGNSIRFLSTICPNCAWNLEGGRDSCVLLCTHCNTAWELSGEGFQRLRFAVADYAISGKDSTYLPFWRIEVEITGMNLKSFGDLVRLANLPKAVKAEWENSVVCLWVPAFKIAPSVFLRTAKQMTLAYIQNTMSDEFCGNTHYSVGIPLSEAVESLKTLLTEIAMNKKNVMDRLEDMVITPIASLLVFYPFQDSAYEFIAEGVRCSVMKNALKWGKNI